MDDILRALDLCYVYIDDILVASASESEHLFQLMTISEKLQHHGIVHNPEKCMFGVPQIDFLVPMVQVHAVRKLKPSRLFRSRTLLRNSANSSIC